MGGGRGKRRRWAVGLRKRGSSGVVGGVVAGAAGTQGGGGSPRGRRGNQQASKGKRKAQDSRSRSQALGCQRLQDVLRCTGLRVVKVVLSLGRVHLVEVMRPRAELLLPAEWPHGPKARPAGRGRRRTEKTGQVALVSSWYSLGQTRMGSTLATAPARPTPILEEILISKGISRRSLTSSRSRRGPKLSLVRQAGSNSATSQKPRKHSLILLFVPVLIWVINNGHEGKPSGYTKETVCGLLRSLEKKV